MLTAESGPTARVRVSRARSLALVAFVVGHLALLAFGIGVYANPWFDTLVHATGGLVNDTLLVNLLGLTLLVGGVMLGRGCLRPADVGLRWSDLRQALAVLVLLWLATQAVAVALAWASTGSVAPVELPRKRGHLSIGAASP